MFSKLSQLGEDTVWRAPNLVERRSVFGWDCRPADAAVAPGDSGGGMTFPNEDRAWFLRGVVSVGSSSKTTYSYFTNVTAFVPWISSVIQKGEVGTKLHKSQSDSISTSLNFTWLGCHMPYNFAAYGHFKSFLSMCYIMAQKHRDT